MTLVCLLVDARHVIQLVPRGVDVTAAQISLRRGWGPVEDVSSRRGLVGLTATQGRCQDDPEYDLNDAGCMRRAGTLRTFL